MEEPPPDLADKVSNEDKNSDPSSPEFEFWMVRNPSQPQPNLASADQLFTNGVILPLDLLNQPRPSAEKPSSWKDIFKAANREKKLETRRKPGGAAEVNININIWPFSRSRSTGTGSGRSRGGSAPGRRVSSAPCSRSSSRGESAKPAPAQVVRRWASSPGRPGSGVYVGRASPVWRPRKPTKKNPPSEGGFLKISSRLRECGAENRRCSESGGGGHFTGLRAFFSKVI